MHLKRVVAMAKQWNRVSGSSAGLVLLMQLALLSVFTVGDEGVCPSYPADSTWKNSMSARQITFIKNFFLSFEGTFEQGAKVLLQKQVSVPDSEIQAAKMVVSQASSSDSRDVYRVSVILTLGFRPPNSQFNPFEIPGKIPAASEDVKIVGNGTFNEATGELCVLGCIFSVCNYKLSLKYPAPKTILDVSVAGNLTIVGEYNDKMYIDPVSIHAFADNSNLDYTMNTTLANVCPTLAPDVVEVGKLWNEDEVGCMPFHRVLRDPIEVTWNPECESANCSPFAELGNIAGGNTSFLHVPSSSCNGNEMQAKLVLSNHPFFFAMGPTGLQRTLLAEGIWNNKTGQMCMVACHHYGKRDCKIAITLQYPLTFTVTRRSSMVGHIQSLRNETDPSYFKRITLRSTLQGSSQGVVTRFPEESQASSVKNQPEYVYTKVGTAKAQCANLPENKRRRSPGSFPSGEDWSDLQFVVVKNLPSPETQGRDKFKIPWQRLNIFTRGDEFVVKMHDQMQRHSGANVTGFGVIGATPQALVQDGIMNVSYSMDYQIGPRKVIDGGGKISGFSARYHVDSIAGEGIYDSKIGKLCLIGCRAVDLKRLKREELQQLEGHNTQKDCQMFFSLQLPAMGSTEALRGSVKSLRLPSDPLYFKPESFSGTVKMQVADSLWREDLEIVLSILMISLTVVFLLRQVRYSKRHPETVPFISISMLLLLSLAHMIPLIVDFEALFQKQQSKMYRMMESVGAWPQVIKVVVRLVTMVAMLLQLGLLQLVWKSRTEARATGKLVPEEQRLSYYILPLYLAGGLIVILVHAMLRFKPYEHGFLWRGGQGGVWWDLHAYAGLLVDLHLLPQVIANILWDATEQAPLSKWFYMGMALVRSVPHLYDLCRQFRFIPSFSDKYLYANPEWDFYSMTSDILIPLFVVLLATMVSMQQTWRGRCVLPRRWRTHSEKSEYEKVENSLADFNL